MIRDILHTGPVMPVIVIHRLDDAVPLARALVAGGVRVLEVTLRTPVALAAVRAICADVPDAIVGVGTVTRAEEFAAARDAGATFAVSPGVSPTLLAAARYSDMPYLPGVMTPSEVILAMEAGYAAMKLFPAKQAGGIDMLNALAGPFPHLVFCPTGGVDAATAADFLALPNVACVGGSWLAPPAAVARQDWADIEHRARETVQKLARK